ncbi:MAG: carotenoid oxygenase family protein, partial [Patulibacter sp.]|nr:carotenoid oxygenase family protein [Patulibacter sp.]
MTMPLDRATPSTVDPAVAQAVTAATGITHPDGLAAALSTDPRAPAPITDDLRTWFSETDGETAHGPAGIEGDLPAWLTGTLIRNGAAAFGRGVARHYLDGSAMLHRFAFPGDGTATYGSRFLRTKARAAMEEGRIDFHEFASDPCRRLAEPIATLFSPRITDNASVNVARLGDEFVAMTETPLPIAFDPATLDTLGVAARPPGRGAFTPTAHPQMDPRTGGWLTTQVHFGPRSSYRVFERHADGTSKQLAKIDTAEPAYLHSFAITERRIVFVEQPLRIRPLDLLAGRKPFIEAFRWKPELGTVFHVLDRGTGRVVRRHQGPAFFVFHHVNAFDDGDDLVVDLCAYDDPSIIDALYLDAEGRLAAATVPTAAFKRYRLAAGRDDVDERVVTEAPLEWPRVAPAVSGRSYRAAYGASAIRGTARGGRVVMVGLVPTGDQPIPMSLAITRELELVGS